LTIFFGKLPERISVIPAFTREMSHLMAVVIGSWRMAMVPIRSRSWRTPGLIVGRRGRRGRWIGWRGGSRAHAKKEGQGRSQESFLHRNHLQPWG
jgi:hypothetical protein